MGLSDFITSAQEAEALAELKTCLFEKVAVNSKKAQNQYPNYFSVTRANHTEKSEASVWKGCHLMRTTGIKRRFLCWRPSLTTVWDRNIVSLLHALGVPMRDLSK